MRVQIMTYRDRTWCSQPCGNYECDRNFTLGEHKNALFWWGSIDYPLARADFKTDNCGYQDKLAEPKELTNE